MQSGHASKTALAAATHRAAHQLLEGGRIFSDSMALRILGRDPEEVRREAEEKPNSRRMRVFIAARTRFAEDALAIAAATQLVVLGAGLDTYAYRGALSHRLRIFEVDHPATQAWKRDRLAMAAIPIPQSLVFAPIDFEKQTLEEGLVAAGFDCAQPTFFTWLGVVPYLTDQAIWSTLTFIAALRNGAHVVFDYSNPPDTLSPESREYHDRRAARVAEIGEAWISYFDTAELHARLRGIGFSNIEDLGPREIAQRYFPTHAASMPGQGGHVAHASL